MSSIDTAAAEWRPQYETWRHGGYYVMNVRYPSGAVGCVSKNYSDGKWRIVCHPDSHNLELAPTFPSRDSAARAERELARGMAAGIAAAAGTGS